jgi:YhcH/YjgK/YiaL family protein
MILDHLDAAGRYAGLNRRFEIAFDFLRQLVIRGDATEETVLVPGEVWASFATRPARQLDDAGFEYHQECADVHLCLRGDERIGWRENADGLQMQQPFSVERDFGLYAGTPDKLIALHGACFALFFPGELHAPLIGEGDLTKVCVKVRLSLSS